MSKKTPLHEAIQALTLHAHSGLRLRDWSDELGVVLAAASAYSCEKCAGTGKVLRPIRRWAVSCDIKQNLIDCDACKMYREIVENQGQ